MRRRPLLLPLVTSIAALLAVRTAAALDYFWDGNATQTANADGGAGIWNATTLNWDNLAVGGTDVAWGNTNADIAIFGAPGGIVSVVPDAPLNVSGLTFTATGYTIGSVANNGTLAFGNVQGKLNASALNTTTDVVNLNSKLTGTAGLTIAASGGTASSGFTFLGGDNRGLTGGITLTRGALTANNTLAFGTNAISIATGSTLLAAGARLQVNNDIILASTTGVTFRAYGSSALVLNGVVSETTAGSAFTIVDSGMVRLNGINTYTGATNINAGTISFSSFGDAINGGNLGKAGDLSFAGGTLRYTGGSVSTSRTLAQAGSGTLDIPNTDSIVTHTGVTSGGVAGRILTKTGLGTLVLSGNVDNSGGRFAINAGVLVLNKTSGVAAHAIGANGNTDLGLTVNGGTVILGGTGGDQIYVNTAVIVNAGLFDMNGRDEGFDSLSGNGGVISNLSTQPSVLTLGQNGNSGGVNNNYAGTMRDSLGTLSLIKVGAGTQILSGLNSYSGTTTISAGTLQIGNGGRLGTGAVTNNGTLAVNSTADVALGNAIGGTGGVTKAGLGLLTLSGTSNYTGATTVSGGTLKLSGTLTSPLTVNAGGILTGSGSTNAGITLNDGAIVLGGTSVVTGNGVTANLTTSGVNVRIAGGIAGTAPHDVINYGAGTAPTLANFSTAGYRAEAIFADDTVNKKVTLTYTAEAKAWNAAVTQWDTGTSATWTGGDTKFQTGDTVTFGDIPADTTVAVVGSVVPSQLAVAHAANTLTLNGAGSIDGTGGLVKSGLGTVTLATANNYTGPTNITAGTVKIGHNSALGAVGAGNETNVSAGATLDLNGGLAANALTLAPEVIRIAGTGVGGTGALVNSGTLAQQNALSYVTLTADAALGGTGRFDIRNIATGSPVLDLAGFKLTKLGTNQFTMVNGTVTGGNIEINAGTFQLEANTSTVGTGTITVNGGATFGHYANTGDVTWPIVANSNGTNGATIRNNGSSATIASNLTLTPASTTTAAAAIQFSIDSGFTTTLTGNIGGTGAVSKVGAGAFVFTGNNNYGGYTLIQAGILRVGSSTAIPATSKVILYNGNSPVFDLNGFNVTVASLQSGSAPDTASVVQLGVGGAKLTVTGNAAAVGPGNVGGQFAGRISGSGDIEYNNLASPQGAWDWLNTGSDFVGHTTITSGRLRFAGVTGALDSTALGNLQNDLIFNGNPVNTLNNQGGAASIQITNGGAGVVTNLGDTRAVTLNSGKEGTFYVWGGSTFTINGPISGGGILRKEDGGTLTLTNSANSYSGETKIVNGTLMLGASNVLPDASLIRLGTSDANIPVLNLNGKSETIAGLTSLQVSNSALLTNGVVTSATPAALTLKTLVDQRFAGTMTGSIALLKTGGAAQALTGANTFDGGVVVSGGTLLASNLTGSGTGTGAVTVQASGTLGGTGILAPTGTNGLTVNGVLAPGEGLGTFTVDLGGTTGGVSLPGGSFKFELGTAGADISSFGLSDRLALSGASAGDFAFSGNPINFGGTGAEGWYKLFDTNTDASTWTGLTIDGSNVITGGLTAMDLGAPGATGQFVMGNGVNGDAGDIYLRVVPEPASVLSLLTGVAALAGLRRRRR
jgi:fibronectin-binding autotransporter adhesin